jgi:hypothetical protein
MHIIQLMEEETGEQKHAYHMYMDMPTCVRVSASGESSTEAGSEASHRSWLIQARSPLRRNRC